MDSSAWLFPMDSNPASWASDSCELGVFCHQKVGGLNRDMSIDIVHLKVWYLIFSMNMLCSIQIFGCTRCWTNFSDFQKLLSNLASRLSGGSFWRTSNTAGPGGGLRNPAAAPRNPRCHRPFSVNECEKCYWDALWPPSCFKRLKHTICLLCNIWIFYYSLDLVFGELWFDSSKRHFHMLVHSIFTLAYFGYFMLVLLCSIFSCTNSHVHSVQSTNENLSGHLQLQKVSSQPILWLPCHQVHLFSAMSSAHIATGLSPTAAVVPKDLGRSRGQRTVQDAACNGHVRRGIWPLKNRVRSWTNAMKVGFNRFT